MPDIIDSVVDSLVEAGAKAAEAPQSVPAQESVEAAAGASMEVLGTYEGESVNSDVIFAGEGLNYRRDFQSRKNPAMLRKLAEVAKVYKAVADGRISLQTVLEAMTNDAVATALVQETMMSSEFSYLLSQTMDRVLLAQYERYSPVYRNFIRTRTVRDFRSVASVRRSAGRGLNQVDEGENYTEGVHSETYYTYSVNKYGKIYSLTWEAIVNDDLDAFASLPRDMAEDAIQEEAYFAASLYVANSTLYATDHSFNGGTHSNKGTAAFTITALIAALNAMAQLPGDVKDGSTNFPIRNRMTHIVIPPALEWTVKQALGSANIVYGGSTQLGAMNPVAGELQIHVDPWIPILDASTGNTSWYMFADVNSGLHAAEMGFLRGYEQPQVFRKATTLEGGSAADGDFDTDAIRYKVRHVFGGSHANATGNWRGTYWSTGGG